MANTIKKFDEFKEMYEFVKAVNDTDVWTPINMEGTSFKAVDPGEEVPRSFFILNDEEELDALEKEGGFFLETSGANYIVNPLAFFTMKSRLGIGCATATKLIDKGEHKKFAEFANIAFSIATKKDKSTLLVRGDEVICMNSAKYNVLDQSTLLKKIQDYLGREFPENEFKGGVFSNEITLASWALGDRDSELAEAYVEAWEEAGLNPCEIEDLEPVIYFATNDIGTQKVSLYPKMEFSNKSYIVGTPVKLRHYGATTTEDVVKAMDLVFAKVKEGSEKMAEMIRTDIAYPVETFVAAAKKVSLHTVVPTIVKEILEDEKISYGISGDATAFMIYDSLMNIQTMKEYNALRPATRTKVNECLERLIMLDWKSLDKPGLRDFS